MSGDDPSEFGVIKYACPYDYTKELALSRAFRIPLDIWDRPIVKWNIPKSGPVFVQWLEAYYFKFTGKCWKVSTAISQAV